MVNATGPETLRFLPPLVVAEPTSTTRVGAPRAPLLGRRRRVHGPGRHSARTVDASLDSTSPPAAQRMRVLLVEDDDGDALLVEELLERQRRADVEIVRARTLAEAPAREPRPAIDCVLLDLDLPDAAGPRRRCTRLREPTAPDLAGARAHRASTTSAAASRRSPPARRTTWSRARSTARCWPARSATRSSAGAPSEPRQQLEVAQLHAEENARLERGLLPAPLVSDPRAALDRALPPGPPARAARRRLLRRRRRTPTARVHAVIGDVSGHGPDEAALGVCLRIAWRTLVLGRRAGRRAARRRCRTCSCVERHARADVHDARAWSRSRRTARARDRAARRPPAAAAARRRRRSTRSSPAPLGPPLGVVDDAALAGARGRAARTRGRCCSTPTG